MREDAVLLVHRPAYDDWSFPKGKLEDGESWEEGAVREVEEETGLRCDAGPYVGSTRYLVPAGLKEVRYYRMSGAGPAQAQNEVDEVRFVPFRDARLLLTHARDRELLDKLPDLA